MDFENNAIETISDILERNPGADFRFTYLPISSQLEVVLRNYETRTNVARLVDRDNSSYICRILLELEKQYQELVTMAKKGSDTN